MRENPLVSVPQVLKRLREKDTEWRQIREEFNVVWQDQIDKNYLKSLDHQAIQFKTTDVKLIRSKAITTQLEQLYEERANLEKGGSVEGGPHVVFEYPECMSVVHDANELLIHHVKRQNIPKKEKFLIKKQLRCLIPQLFNIELETMSDDEEDADEEDAVEEAKDKPKERNSNSGSDADDEKPAIRRSKRLQKAPKASTSKATSDAKARQTRPNSTTSSTFGYTLFFGTNNWLLFIRLYHMICERLALLKRRAEELAEEYEFEKLVRERQTKLYEKYGCAADPKDNAVDVHLGLRELKKPLQNPENFYPTMIQELKNALDGITDFTNFEETLRSSASPLTHSLANFRNMFGTSAYVMFTMDKLISQLTRQLQVIEKFIAIEITCKPYLELRFRRDVHLTVPELLEPPKCWLRRRRNPSTPQRSLRDGSGKVDGRRELLQVHLPAYAEAGSRR